jgi:hypothetical protein
MSGDGEMLGPVQLLVCGFDPEAEMRGEILAELGRLSDAGTIRVLDVLVVRKEDDDTVSIVEANEGGSVVAVLTGLHGDEQAADLPPEYEDIDDADVWFPADEIPAGSTAALALIEHRWALGLKQALRGTGGALIAESWIDPLDLQAVGLNA